MIRCEGYRKYSAFQVGGGTGRWEQCKNTATVTVKFRDGKKIKSLPACEECLKECIENKVEILSTKSLIQKNRGTK